MKARTRSKSAQAKESIIAFKRELLALTFEPIYGSSFKDVLTRLTVKIQELASSYGYEVEFANRATKVSEGDGYYFEYPLKVKKGSMTRKLRLGVQYLFYEDGKWVGMLVDVKP